MERVFSTTLGLAACVALALVLAPSMTTAQIVEDNSGLDADTPGNWQSSTGNANLRDNINDGDDNWLAQNEMHFAKAPFGQNNGKLAPLKGNCTNPQCGCSITPRTLWEKEVLLMQQTFELPELRDDCRYRLVIGGSGHAFSGEGFAVYVNGKLYDQADSGFFKRGGSRGKIIWNDFLPDFQSGKVTIAVKAFLRTTHWVNRPAPPRGHMSVWIEQAQLPEVVTRAFGKSDK